MKDRAIRYINMRQLPKPGKPFQFPDGEWGLCEKAEEQFSFAEDDFKVFYTFRLADGHQSTLTARELFPVDPDE